MNGLEPLIPISLFLSVAAVVILRGPFGKALADRLGGHPARGSDDARTRVLEEQLEDVQFRLRDLEERLDYAERAVPKGRDALPLAGER